MGEKEKFEAWRGEIEEKIGYKPLGFVKVGSAYLVIFRPKDAVEMGYTFLEESGMEKEGVLESFIVFAVDPKIAESFPAMIVEVPMKYPGFEVKKKIVFVTVPTKEFALLFKAEFVKDIKPLRNEERNLGGASDIFDASLDVAFYDFV